MDRDRLFGVYRETLAAYGFAFDEIAGEGDARYQLAEACVRRSGKEPS